MRWLIAVVIVLVSSFVSVPMVFAQEEVRSDFHGAVLNAGLKAVKSGQMRRADFFRMRVAMLSPAFRQKAEDLAVIQMCASESDNVPIGEDGQVDRGSIDWEALAVFLERLLPLILQLIDAFSYNDVVPSAPVMLAA